MPDYKYFAFISYRSTDREWAQWLQHMLEHYRLPSVVNGKELPDSLYPVFLDTSELSGGTLGDELSTALESSRYLIVICSPESAQSQWVNKEVQSFVDRGEIDRVIPFIIAGTPYGANDNCFVPALTRLRGSEMEQLGISVNESGREPAAVKVISRMLGLRFNDLWKRHERDKEAERLKLVETNNHIRRNLARYVSEKALSLLKEGDGMTALRLTLEVLPSPENPDFPVTAEAEGALRRSISIPDRSYLGFVDINCMAVHPDGQQVAYGDLDGNIRIFDITTSRELHSMRWEAENWDYPSALAFHPDGKHLVFGTESAHIRLWNLTTDEIIDKEVDYMHLAEVKSIEFSPDGRYMVTAYNSGFVIWDAESFNWLSEVERTKEFCINGICISPDGRYILCAGVELSMYTFDTKQPRPVWRVRSRCQSNAIFSPDGKRIICTFNNHISCLESATGRKIISYINTYEIEHLLFVPDGSMILGSGQGPISYILSDPYGDGRISEPFQREDGMRYVGALLPCAAPLLSLLGYSGVQGRRKLISNPLRSSTDNLDEYIGFDESGKAIITDYEHRTMPPEGFKVELQKSHGNTSVTVSDTHGIVIGHIDDIPLNVEFHALSPDGRYIALFEDYYGEIWSVRDGVSVDCPNLPCDAIKNQIAFSPDGRTFVMLTMCYDLYTYEFKPLEELITEARAKCEGITFSAEERRKYYLDL